MSTSGALSIDAESKFGEVDVNASGVPVTRVFEGVGITATGKVGGVDVDFIPTDVVVGQSHVEPGLDADYGVTKPSLASGAVPVGALVDLGHLVDVVSNHAVGGVAIDSLLGGGISSEDLVNTIPVTSITASPTRLADQIGLRVSVKARSVSQALEEVTTARHDEKPRGLWYLAGLRFLNRTWGEFTELLDFYEVLKWNIYLEPGVYIYVDGRPIRLSSKQLQRLGELPVEYQAAVLKMILTNNIDWSLDFEGLITGVFTQELTDTMIGVMMRSERKIIRELGLRGPLDYGNVSTWARRISRLLEVSASPGREREIVESD